MFRIILLTVFVLTYFENVLAQKGLLKEECPEVVDTKCPNENITYWLYTITNKNGVQIVKTEDLTEYNSTLTSRKLVILIHGYGENVNNSQTILIKEKLLEIQQANVLSIDYSPLAPRGCYLESVKNSRVIGKCLAQFIDFLIQDTKVPNSNIHVIGFSLGAQVAGVAGHFSTKKLKRITGLDPSKNLIMTENNNTFRLDSSDAEYVDVLSTDPTQRGYLDETIAHCTFFANFGFYQPGCLEENITANELSLCSHRRAPQYYAESIVTLTPFQAYECDSWQQYESLRCVPNIFRLKTMGYFLKVGLKGSYFASTNKESPFSRGYFGILRSRP